MQEIKSNHWVTHDKEKEKHNIIMLFISLSYACFLVFFLSFSFNFSRFYEKKKKKFNVRKRIKSSRKLHLTCFLALTTSLYSHNNKVLVSFKNHEVNCLNINV